MAQCDIDYASWTYYVVFPLTIVIYFGVFEFCRRCVTWLFFIIPLAFLILVKFAIDDDHTEYYHVSYFLMATTMFIINIYRFAAVDYTSKDKFTQENSASGSNENGYAGYFNSEEEDNCWTRLRSIEKAIHDIHVMVVLKQFILNHTLLMNTLLYLLLIGNIMYLTVFDVIDNGISDGSDIKDNNLLNTMVSCILVITLAFPNSQHRFDSKLHYLSNQRLRNGRKNSILEYNYTWRITYFDYQYTKFGGVLMPIVDILASIDIFWLLLYNSWYLLFIYTYFTCNFLVLSIPVIVPLLYCLIMRQIDIWFESRMYCLGIFVFMEAPNGWIRDILGIYCYNTYVEDVWTIINFVLAIFYLFYYMLALHRGQIQCNMMSFKTGIKPLHVKLDKRDAGSSEYSSSEFQATRTPNVL